MSKKKYTEKEIMEKLREVKTMLDAETVIQFNLHEKIHDLYNIIEEILEEI